MGAHHSEFRHFRIVCLYSTSVQLFSSAWLVHAYVSFFALVKRFFYYLLFFSFVVTAVFILALFYKRTNEPVRAS